MTRRRDIQHHLSTLGEISSVLVAMKNMAIMETRKLNGFLESQQRAVAGIETAAADFLSFYLKELPPQKDIRNIYLVAGSERGFCGDFNETLVKSIPLYVKGNGLPPLIVAVGRRLEAKLQGEMEGVTFIEGSSVAEEVPQTISRLADYLDTLQQSGDSILSLTAVYHNGEAGTVKSRRLLPMPDLRPPSPGFPYPPLLNLPAFDFFSQLTEHYLYAALHEVLYLSLMAENLQRMEHMEGALKWLDKETARLTLVSNSLRQEEIVEEIEVIMLSADAVAENEQF